MAEAAADWKSTGLVIPKRLNMAEEALRHAFAPDAHRRVAFKTAAGPVLLADLEQGIARFAGALRARGVRSGERVLIRMTNGVPFAVAILGAIRIGAVPVLQNAQLGRDEVEYVLAHSGAVLGITQRDVIGPLEALGSRLPHGLIVADGTAGLDRAFVDAIAPAPPVRGFESCCADDPALIVYTSGTTGRPKGIVHAHRWVIALGESNRRRLPPAADDVVMATGEWSFISALGHNVMFALRNGVTAAVLEERPAPERILEAVAGFGVTLLFSVATVYRRILSQPDIEHRYDTSSLRGCNATGEALQAATKEEWQRRFHCTIWEHYGVSESQLLLGQGPGLAMKTGSVGVPWGVEAGLFDDDGTRVGAGEVGHLMFKLDYPGFFLRYHKDAERTAETCRDGWYHTNDLARRDADGHYFILGRKDDCFKSKGIFISPQEIEDALLRHPEVAEACVLPLPDPDIGFRIRAVVVLKHDPHPGDDTAAALRRFLDGRIAAYKIPHRFEFIPSLPKSPVGKVLRRSLM